VNVEDSLRLRIDESYCFGRLHAVIHPAAVVLAGVFTVEERRIDGSVTAWVVQLRRQAQQHSPECCLDSVKPLDWRRVIREISCVEADFAENMWHLAQQIQRFPVGLLQVNPQTVQRHHRILGEAATLRGAATSPRSPTAFLANCTTLLVKREIFDMNHRQFPASYSWLLPVETDAVQRFTRALVFIIQEIPRRYRNSRAAVPTYIR